MQITLSRAVWVAGVLTAATLTPAARAQLPSSPYPFHDLNRTAQPASVRVQVFTNTGLRTTVTVPDGGSVTVGSYSQLSEGRNEFGVPILGRVPYAGRGFRNVGYGRDAVSGRVGVSVRIIDLREEEYLQTGVRSR
jgi:type II secretory pathway component GspD/PulD (secretin)